MRKRGCKKKAIECLEVMGHARESRREMEREEEWEMRDRKIGKGEEKSDTDRDSGGGDMLRRPRSCLPPSRLHQL